MIGQVDLQNRSLRVSDLDGSRIFDHPYKVAWGMNLPARSRAEVSGAEFGKESRRFESREIHSGIIAFGRIPIGSPLADSNTPSRTVFQVHPSSPAILRSESQTVAEDGWKIGRRRTVVECLSHTA